MTENNNPNKECHGCGLEFLLKTTPEHCMKCEKLAPHKIGSEEYVDISQYPQCAICGITRRNGMTAANPKERCCASVACQAILNQMLSKKPDTTPETHNVLTEVTRNRFRLDTRAANLPVGTALTTNQLLRHQHGGGEPGEPQIIISCASRLKGSKSTDTDIGLCSKRFARSAEVIEEFCDYVNTTWTRNQDRPKIVPEDVQLRFHGNKVPLPNTSTLTVGEFYSQHAASHVAWYLDVAKLPGIFKTLAKNSGKVPFMAMEVYIDTEHYYARMERSGYDIQSTSKKGKGTNKRAMEPPSEIPLSKRQAVDSATAQVSILPKSTFRPSKHNGGAGTRSVLPVATSTVRMEKHVLIFDPSNWETTLEVSESGLQVRIQNSPFAKGTMKLAYDITVPPGSRMVGKRLFKLADDVEESALRPLNVEEANVRIQAEYRRLIIGAEMLKSFLQATKHLEVFRAIQFATAFILKETDLTPSKPSGQKSDSFLSEGLLWLVEDKRSRSVRKFTGTMEHTRQTDDLVSLTIDAFVHYAFGQSRGQYVFADMQGTPAPINGVDGFVLFDPMTHTPAGDSGVGDFGKEGMQQFFSQHQCGRICKQMTMDREYPLEFTKLDDGEDSDMELSHSPPQSQTPPIAG